jgi:uncharacterized Zn finger protein
MSPFRQRRRWPSAPPPGRGSRVPAARGAGSRRGFGATWWGRAWVEALEQRARLDPNRLPRGRGYARSGAVGELAISPGEIRAAVQGSRRTPYTVQVRVRPFGSAEWERVLDVVAGQLGHTAALLDGELPPEVVDDVAAAGLDLLPGPGEVGPRCSCPDWADPCKHAAAVCYLVADALDADPFKLLLLRGQSKDEVLAGLRSRRRAAAGASPDGVQPATDDRGVLARSAYAATSAGPPRLLPLPPLPPHRPGHPAAVRTDPPAGSPVDRAALVALAEDAASRAWALAVGVGDGGLSLDHDSDIARRAAARLGTPELRALAPRADLPVRELTRWAIAWREGGADGLAALRGSWQPEPAELAEGRAALSAAGGAVVIRGNRVTAGDVQLRLDQDGLWYRFVRSSRGWDLDAPPDPDPAALVTDGRARN